ncbi:threonine synthase [Ascidiimonas aurantiaca]|uniref:threonine synthase n=1 Tax=Ascidiimonas aurantiaca TaxID=1685432 RepID=UPI0030EB259A
MYYKSLNNHSAKASFKEAVINGLAPDKGLYFPEAIPSLSRNFIENLHTLSHSEIAFHVIQPFIGKEIPSKTLSSIIEDTLCFDFPLVEILPSVFSLELFHGPTMAFKDVGARFMARCLGYFNSDKNENKITVLVATSGDTGGAVANGFLGVDHVNVVILYPSGKVSAIQEKQLTTLGQNITALEVNGTFDDCQEMVKTAFLDQQLASLRLTSANSINIARWLPQMFYYFFAYKTLQEKKIQDDLVISVPSGNFGNICAGMIAMRLGLPVTHFIAATNVNDTVVKFLETGIYEPKSSIQTVSNAMDVGNPSNFVRIQKLMNNDIHKLKSVFSSYSFSDKATRKAMKHVYKKTGYILDPHGAIGYLGLIEHFKSHPQKTGVFLETAHPAKFLDTVESVIGESIDIPEQLALVINQKKHSIQIKDYEALKSYLLS